VLMNGPVPHQLVLSTERYGDTTLVRLSGEMDIACEEYFERSMQPLERAGSWVVLDLSGLTFMDSTGLRLILRAWDHSRRDGFQLAVLPGTGPARRLLEVAGLHRVLPIAEDLPLSLPSGKS
jgi:anti-sigma B factor antagonist